MNKKQRILLTMLELAVKQGFHATPMSQIAREANVAVGTIYHYFKSKEQIIENIYLMIYKDFGVIMLANINPKEEFKNQFVTMWLNLYNYFVSNPLAFYFIECVAVPPLITPEIAKQTQSHYAAVTRFCLKGIEEKKLKNMPIILILNLCYGMISSAVKLKTNQQLPMHKNQLDQTIASCWDAVKFSESKLFT